MTFGRNTGADPPGDVAIGRERWWSVVIAALEAMRDRQAATVPGARVLDIPGVVGMTGMRSWIYVHAPVDPDVLADAVDRADPAAFVLLAGSVATSVDEALRARGWSSHHPLDLMVAVEVHAPSSGGVAGVTVEPVGAVNAQDAQQVCDLAFGSPGDLSSWVRAVDCGGLLARDGAGRGIAVAGWQRAGTGARLENVATAVDRRGEGLGVMMTARAVAAATAAGAEFTFLEATEAGVGVYRRIGFEHLARWRVYRRTGSTQQE